MDLRPLTTTDDILEQNPYSHTVMMTMMMIMMALLMKITMF